MRRLWAPVVAVLAAAALLSACSNENDRAEQLRDAITRTERLAARFTYTETHESQKVTVQGIVEDDFRYKARVSVDGRATLDEVVDDDAVYVRLLAPGSLDMFLAEDVNMAAASDRDGVPVVDLLQARRWVVDDDGAPPVFAAAVDGDLGADPISDALAVLEHVRQAADDAFAVREYSKEALDYKPSEDPFPTPEEGSGVTRFDLVAPWFPRPGDATSAGSALASTKHFRKMSVYVKDGVIIQVMEQVAATGDVARDFMTYVRAFLKDLDPGALEAFEAAYEDVPERQRSAFLTGALNDFRERAGEDPVRPRTMVVQFVDLGADSTIDIPTGAIGGELTVLRGRGRLAVGETGEASDDTASQL